MPPLFIVSSDGVPLVEDTLPRPPIDSVDDYKLDMNELAKLAEEEARKASAHKKVSRQEE